MAKIGVLKVGGADDFRGHLSMVHGDVPVRVVPDPHRRADAPDGAPTHEINGVRPDGTMFNIGPVWTVEITRGPEAGRKGYQIVLDHPEFPALRASAFPISEREYLIRTDRPRQDAANAGS